MSKEIEDKALAAVHDFCEECDCKQRCKGICDEVRAFYLSEKKKLIEQERSNRLRNILHNHKIFNI